MTFLFRRDMIYIEKNEWSRFSGARLFLASALRQIIVYHTTAAGLPDEITKRSWRKALWRKKSLPLSVY